MKYKIRYVETLEMYVEIDAENEDAAIEEFENQMKNEKGFFDDLEMADSFYDVVERKI